MRLIPLRNDDSSKIFLLMHGSTQKYYDEHHPLFKILKKRKGNIYSVELPGHGKSSFNRKLSAQEYVELFLSDFNNILQNQDFNEYFLVGYSLGGMLALKTLELKNSRIKKVIAIASGLVIEEEEEKRIQYYFTKENYSLSGYENEMIFLHGNGWDPLIETLHELFYRSSPILLDKEKIKGTPSKALIILGEKDEAFTALKSKKVCHEYFNVDIKIIPDINHFQYFNKAKNDLEKIIDYFLDE